jgi:hypothetical protein
MPSWHREVAATAVGNEEATAAGKEGAADETEGRSGWCRVLFISKTLARGAGWMAQIFCSSVARRLFWRMMKAGGMAQNFLLEHGNSGACGIAQIFYSSAHGNSGA